MRFWTLLLIYSGSLAGGACAHARMFDYKNAGVAAYFRGTGGLTNLAKDAFDKADGAGTKVSGSSAYAYGGEIGALFNFTPDFHMRVGIELMQPSGLSKAKGSSSSGTERFRLDSSAFVFNPNVVFEYVQKTQGNLRFYYAAGIGYADVSVENKYQMTAGSDLATANYTEKLGGTGISGTVMMGLETLFVDNATLALDIGYRYMPISSLRYKNDGTGFNGAFGKGDDALDVDGKKRSLDLGGLILGASFRFYLNFL